MKKIREQIAKEYEEMTKEFLACKDGVVKEFLDISSIENLDKKIDMLKKVNSGVPLEEIKGWKDLLEKYPRAKKGEEIFW